MTKWIRALMSRSPQQQAGDRPGRHPYGISAQPGGCKSRYCDQRCADPHTVTVCNQCSACTAQRCCDKDSWPWPAPAGRTYRVK